MNQRSMSEMNRRAWNHRTEEAWTILYGKPSVFAKQLAEDPKKHLSRTIDFLGDVTEKRIINLLGSNGRKAVPLALLGANVTVVDLPASQARWTLRVG
jgi:hypothetical protein